MSQQIELPPKIVPNEQVYQQHLKEESKKEESPAEKKSKSSSMSEFVYNPDPDFLNRINANIRQNNDVIEGQIPMHLQQPFQQDHWNLSEDGSQNEVDRAARGRPNSEQYQQNQDQPNHGGHPEIIQRSDEKVNQPMEELISDYGNDF